MPYTKQKFDAAGVRSVFDTSSSAWVLASSLTQDQLGLAVALPTTGTFFGGGIGAST